MMMAPLVRKGACLGAALMVPIGSTRFSRPITAVSLSRRTFRDTERAAVMCSYPRRVASGVVTSRSIADAPQTTRRSRFDLDSDHALGPTHPPWPEPRGRP